MKLIGGIIFPDFKLYYKAIVIRIWFKNKYTDQWNRTENPEINLCIYDKWIHDKEGKNIQWRRIVSSINGFGKTGQPQGIQ